MQNKSDILIDVSFNLTDWWLKHRVDGEGFYSEFPELYCENYPATIKDVINLIEGCGDQECFFILESISSGLFEMFKEDGVI